VKEIMCKNKNCDYPVTKKITQMQLAISLNNFQDFIKEKNTKDQEWFEMIYKKTIDDKFSEQYCTVCAIKKLMMTLFLEKKSF
jgi:hypothetical protein